MVKALRFLCINFQSARKKGKDISALVESVQPDIIMGMETWLSEDVCSSEFFDTSLGFDMLISGALKSPPSINTAFLLVFLNVDISSFVLIRLSTSVRFRGL
jgi:hypothetical protein